MPKEKVSEGISFETWVDATKRERACLAVEGLSIRRTPLEGLSVESKLRVRGIEEGLKGDELALYIYRGLGGLVDLARAKKNRENEAKAAKIKRSR